MKITHFFLGANSGGGFFSLYDEMINLREARRVYIIKGGPGTGKSTFMKNIGNAAEAAGEDVEYLHCSADANSLDGIVLPGKKCAVVDGTSPHVIDARYLGAVEQYINMGMFCRDGRLDRERIILAADAYPVEYPGVYRLLSAAEGLSRQRREKVTTDSVVRALKKRADGVCAREFGGKSRRQGSATRRFMSAITPQGVICRYDTAEALCGRVYDLVSAFELGDIFLKRLQEGAIRSGKDVISCLSPLDPSMIEHLLIPSEGLAFVTSGRLCAREGKPYRRLRLDNSVDKEKIKSESYRLRFMAKTESALISEAVEALTRIKASHDELEALYNPHIDFDGVRQLAKKTASELLNY